ncbi:MAG: hypothetical protein ACRC4N_18160 [Gammaproteobacteria bacterium]
MHTKHLSLSLSLSLSLFFMRPSVLSFFKHPINIYAVRQTPWT